MKNLKLLLSFMKGNKLLYTGAVICVALATLFSLVIPLIIRFTIDSIIGDEPLRLPEWFLNLLEQVGLSDRLLNSLWLIGLFIVLLTLIRGFFLYFKGKWSATASETIARNLREKLYDHIQHLPYNYHLSAETGDLIQRCTSDVETIRRFLAVQFVEMGRAIFMLTLISWFLFNLHVKLTLIAMTVIPIIITFSFIFYRRVKHSFKLAEEAEGRLSTTLQENLTGVRVVRAFANQAFEIDKYNNKNIEFRDLVYRVISQLAWFWSISDCLSMLQMGAVLVLGVFWAAEGMITLGTLVVFITYEGMLLWPVRQLGRILTDLGKTLVALGRIQEILDQPHESEAADEIKPELNGDIEFKDVWFSYNNEEPVLKNLSFSINKGETIAITGPTGSGKSSLVHLLARLYDYDKGSIAINGYKLKDINKKWLRKHVGLVLQEPFLFARTVKENIALPRNNVKDAEIFEAAREAAIHNVIEDFENGYETIVGERGVSLSGGQKQRIAIARTLIRDCPILIFDDSLSAVDTETDAAIRQALKKKSREKTTIIISHRINTLSEADKILVLDEGRLVQSGTHEQLIKQKGIYNRLWVIQNSLEDEFKEERRIKST